MRIYSDMKSWWHIACFPKAQLKFVEHSLSKIIIIKLGVVAHAFSPSTYEAEAGESL